MYSIAIWWTINLPLMPALWLVLCRTNSVPYMWACIETCKQNNWLIPAEACGIRGSWGDVNQQRNVSCILANFLRDQALFMTCVWLLCDVCNSCLTCVRCLWLVCDLFVMFVTCVRCLWLVCDVFDLCVMFLTWVWCFWLVCDVCDLSVMFLTWVWCLWLVCDVCDLVDLFAELFTYN